MEHQEAGPRRRVRTDSARNDGEERGARAGESVRRGHSDGDVLSRGHDTFNEQLLGNGETWVDFLRHSDTSRETRERAEIAIRRAAMMSADRRRRFMDQHADNTRRRSSSNVLFGQLANGRRRPGMPYPVSEHTVTPLPISGTMDTSSGQRILDRPLPRRPSCGIQHSRRSEDVSLPRWQPDGEVTKCPICGTPFSFWYRKHHCRKCGRVVCANCSPHRITIPRQYIVHPPDRDPGSTSGTGSGIEIVDLTGDNEENTTTSSRRPRQTDRRHSQDHRIDPALGGGQEVRLCNPCVPDPNPLPHLYPSPARFSLDSFPRPDSIAQNPPSLIAPPRSSSIQHRLPAQPVRASPDSQICDVSGDPNSEASVVPFNLIVKSIGSLLLTIDSVACPSLQQRLHDTLATYLHMAPRQTRHCIT